MSEESWRQFRGIVYFHKDRWEGRVQTRYASEGVWRDDYHKSVSYQSEVETTAWVEMQVRKLKQEDEQRDADICAEREARAKAKVIT